MTPPDSTPDDRAVNLRRLARLVFDPNPDPDELNQFMNDAPTPVRLDRTPAGCLDTVDLFNAKFGRLTAEVRDHLNVERCDRCRRRVGQLNPQLLDGPLDPNRVVNVAVGPVARLTGTGSEVVFAFHESDAAARQTISANGRQLLQVRHGAAPPGRDALTQLALVRVSGGGRAAWSRFVLLTEKNGNPSGTVDLTDALADEPRVLTLESIPSPAALREDEAMLLCASAKGAEDGATWRGWARQARTEVVRPQVAAALKSIDNSPFTRWWAGAVAGAVAVAVAVVLLAAFLDARDRRPGERVEPPYAQVPTPPAPEPDGRPVPRAVGVGVFRSGVMGVGVEGEQIKPTSDGSYLTDSREADVRFDSTIPGYHAVVIYRPEKAVNVRPRTPDLSKLERVGETFPFGGKYTSPEPGQRVVLFAVVTAEPALELLAQVRRDDVPAGGFESWVRARDPRAEILRVDLLRK